MTTYPRLALLTLTACLVSAPPLPRAQEIEITAEDEAKPETYTAFRANIDGFLPTVNLYDDADLPVTFPFREVMAHAPCRTGSRERHA